MGEVHFGKLKSEKLAEDNQKCRQIVADINNMGLSDDQCVLLIYLLAMQIENFEHSREIAESVRMLREDLFLVELEEENGSTINNK